MGWFLLGAPWDCSGSGRGEMHAPGALREAGLTRLVDVLDSSAMPAVTYPQPGGPDLDQLAAVLPPLAASPRLIGVSVADFRPDLDPDGRHAAQLVALLNRIL